MPLTYILRLNALSCVFFGLLMAQWPDSFNTLLGNQYPEVIMPAGWITLAYGLWLFLASRRVQPSIKELVVFIACDYGWTILMIVLVSMGLIVVESAGIRVAMLTALFTAAMGALQFRHYKLLAGKY
ncbi:MAG: hypothetical protein GY881_06410 [Gammaproteobacteria bacterium]|jgi:hypothetical protein|nr:hypothetical protein [Gammaproteobacteria bacterium]MCP4881883.1 hypothetical protein [Gammaproteobacteria bacterium]MDP6165022.1 hypothetical protein [Gammaproteobacteria bacterium]